MSEKPKRSPEWERAFMHLASVQQYCYKYIASWGSASGPIDRLWCDALFMRSFVAVRSVVVLIHHDAVDDAGIILRTMLEIEFQLGAIKADREIAVRLLKGAEGARLKRLKRFRDSERPLPEGVTAEAIDRQLEEAKEIASELKKRFLAKQANLESEYDTFYSALSDIAHVSAIGLRNYFEDLGQGREGVPNVRIVSGKSLLSAELVMALAGATQLEILRIIREMRAAPADQELEALLLETGQIIASVRQQGL